MCILCHFFNAFWTWGIMVSLCTAFISLFTAVKVARLTCTMYMTLELCFMCLLNGGSTAVLLLISSDTCIDFLHRAQLVSQDFQVPMERKVQGYDNSFLHNVLLAFKIQSWGKRLIPKDTSYYLNNDKNRLFTFKIGLYLYVKEDILRHCLQFFKVLI